MTVENRLSAPKRRTRAEVQRLVAEFVSSGMRRSEFCRSRGLSFGTLDRHLKKRRWRGKRRSVPADGRLVPVELATKESTAEHKPSCGLAVMLSCGRYAELKIRVLEERLRLMRIEKYGTAGEKLSDAQLQLFELEPVVSEIIEQAESEHAPVHRSTKESGKHPGRQELPPNLPRVERVLPCSPD